ncbi:hypothetical protein CC78DRAFT_361841 [Lojkania enalia]|uniref:KANL3/Tex30 alpha/beta hydrolase-like domain-containing protein n=1 Tax=Lojkania enalia TaxID=147567 RepID=A0A9P4MXA6_9PLEO|nr:hypothetical protein CC78DRAFT_361841 [Didymosphaeria enalia]
MPPKRRAPAEPLSAQVAKRRSTRSLTKSARVVKEPPESQPIGSKVKDPISEKAKLSKSKSTSSATPSMRKSSKSAEPKSNATGDVASRNANDPATFKIAGAGLKNPIPCQRFGREGGKKKHEDGKEILIFTHGAGGTLATPAVVNFCTGFGRFLRGLAFQGTVNLAARIKGFHACAEYLVDEKEWGYVDGKKGKMVIGGRSMGARAAVTAAKEMLGEEKEGKSNDMNLILVSYPLKGPKDDIRDRILIDLSKDVRILFITGDRDSMCPLDMLQKVRKKMKAKSWLIVVKGADHGMHVKPAKAEKVLGEMTGQMAAEWTGIPERKEDEVVWWSEKKEEVEREKWSLKKT